MENFTLILLIKIVFIKNSRKSIHYREYRFKELKKYHTKIWKSF